LKPDFRSAIWWAVPKVRRSHLHDGRRRHRVEYLLLKRCPHGVLVDGLGQRIDVLLIGTVDHVELLSCGGRPAELQNKLHQLNRKRVHGFGSPLLCGELFGSSEWADRQRLGRHRRRCRDR